MSTGIKIEIDENARRLIERFGNARLVLAPELCKVLDAQNELTVSAIQQERLSAPANKVWLNDAGVASDKKSKRKGFMLRSWSLSALSDKQALHVRTNLLRKSIRESKATGRGNSITSSIGSNVKYAAIHEYGGTTKPHIIRSLKRKSLAFLGKEGRLFRRQVNHPGSRIPARPYVAPAIAERRGEYNRELSAAVMRVLGGMQP